MAAVTIYMSMRDNEKQSYTRFSGALLREKHTSNM